MARTVELAEFEAHAADLIDSVAKGGEPVIVVRAGAPLVLVASPDASGSPSMLGDLPRWEEWVHTFRESYAEAAGSSAGPQVEVPEPPVLDKALLGFDPVAGVAGSEAGREFLAAELERLDVPVREGPLLAEIYAAVLRLCEDKERIYEADLRVLAQDHVAQAPSRLRLLSATLTSSTGLPATAEVTVELGHGPAMRREHGDGPLDAAYKAIQKLTGLEPEVENFSVVAATKGSDAMAEAVIELRLEGQRAVGAGASTNAIEAGIHAYVNALNFLMEARAPV